MRQRLLISGALAALMPGLAWSQTAEFPSPVVVAEVTQVAMPRRVSLFGTVEPFKRSRVAAETEGRVEEFPFVEGQPVTKGCVLAKVRTDILEIRREAAMAALAEASAELERLRNGYRSEEIEAARARAAVLESLAADAESDLERTETLIGDGAASVEDLDKARILLAAAESRLAEASATLTMMLAGYRTEEIAKARAQLRQREADLARTRQEIADASVTAPFDGLIAGTRTEVGQWLANGDAVVELIQLDPVLVHVDVPERYLAGLRLGRSATVTFNAFPDLVREGQVARLVPEANVAARTFGVKIELPNPDHQLLAGLLASVELEVGEPQVVLAVPKDAIVLSAQGNAVFVVNERRAKLIPVEVGDAYNGLVAIQGRVEVGARVVVRGNERLRDGQSVTVQSAVASASQP